jgi:hypothetical protein
MPFLKARERFFIGRNGEISPIGGENCRNEELSPHAMAVVELSRGAGEKKPARRLAGPPRKTMPRGPRRPERHFGLGKIFRYDDFVAP